MEIPPRLSEGFPAPASYSARLILLRAASWPALIRSLSDSGVVASPPPPVHISVFRFHVISFRFFRETGLSLID